MKKILFFLIALFTATFNYAQLLPNVTNSWLGNTFGVPATHIPHNLDNLYVTPSGKVATITGWDEGGHNVKVYDTNGNQISVPQQSGTGSWGRNSGTAVFLDDTYIYQVFKQHGCDGGNGDGINYPVCGIEWQCIRRYNMNGTGAPFASGKGYDRSFMVVTTDKAGLNGVLVYNNELYVSDVGADKIKVYNATTMSDIPVRTFSVGSGGVMDYDSQGNLWVLDSKQQKLVRFSTTGTVLPQQIVFPANINATAFCVDKINNRILVTNNGVDQNVLIYSDIFINPNQTSTFGITGGINAGVMGEILPLKFSEPKGVGIDNLGNIYVGNNGVRQGGVRLEKYNTSSTLQWTKLGMIFTDMGTMDSETETDFYTKEFHLKLNLQSVAPGSEWSVKGSTINRFAYPEDERLISETFYTTSYLRNVFGKKILFTTDMYGSNLVLSKFTPSSGEIALPSAFFSAKDNKEFIWTDINNNQTHQSNEYDNATAINMYGTHIVPDQAGNVWRTYRENGIRFFPVKGIDANGNPMYSYATSTLFANPTGMHDVKRIEYDVTTGDLYVTGRNLPSVSDEWWCAGNTLAKYSNYLNNPNAAPTWSITLPYLPVTDENVKSFCVEGDYVFTIAHRKGKILVRKTLDGTLIGEILPGAPTAFRSAWADINGAIRVHKRPNGEFLVFAEENGDGKIMMYRWCPTGTCTETTNTLVTNTNYFNYAPASTSQTLNITSNIGWSVTGIPAWLTLSTTSGTANGTINITTSANSTGTNRTAILTLTGGGITKTVTVFQGFVDSTIPSPITGLTSSAITPFGFNLSWNASTDNVLVTEYEILRNGILFTTVKGTSTKIEGLTPSTANNMTVRAKDATGNTSASASTNVNTIAIPFPYITVRGENTQYNEGKAKAFDGNNFSKWSDNSRTSWIQIQYASAIVYNQYTIVSGNDIPMRDPLDWDLQASNDGITWTTLSSKTNEKWTARNNGRTFYFQNSTAYSYYKINITKNNGENAIQLSEIIYGNGIIVDNELPKAPVGLTASSITANSLTLSWWPSKDDVGVTGYEIFQDGISIANLPSGATSYDITGLTISTIYNFTIKAKDAVPSYSIQNPILTVITDLKYPFYFKPAQTDLANLANWGINTNGTGTAPSNFTSIGDKFILTSSKTLSSNLTLGAGTTFQVGTTVSPATLTLNNNFSVNGALNLTNGKLALGNNTLSLNGAFTGSATNCLQANGSSNLVITGTTPLGGSLFFDQTSPGDVLGTATTQVSNGTTNRLASFTLGTIGATSKTVVLGNQMQVTGVVGLNSGTLDAGTGGKLVLISTATTSAHLATLQTGAFPSDLIGTVNVQSFFKGGDDRYFRGFRMIASPIEETLPTANFFSNMKNRFIITGPAGGGFDLGGSLRPNSATIQTYNEVPALQTQSYVNLPTISTPVVAGKGYYFFYRGSKVNATTSKVNSGVSPYLTGRFMPAEDWTATYIGTINKGDFDIPVTFTNNASDTYNGYNLIGNPYPSTIDFSQNANAIINNAGNTPRLTNFLSIMKPDRTGFVTLSGGVISNPMTAGDNIRFIQPGQAFFVKVTSSGNIKIKESNKNDSTAPTRLLDNADTNQERQLIRLRLLDGEQYEETTMVLEAGNLSKFEGFDAPYFSSNGNVMCNTITSDGVNTAINFLPAVDEVSEIKIAVNATETKTSFKLLFTDLTAVIAKDVYLKDNYLSTLTPIDAANNQYIFGIDKAIPTTFGNERFVLIIQPKAVLPITLKSFTAAKQNTGVKLNWETISEKNVSHFEIQRSSNGETFSTIGKIKAAGNSASIHSYIDKAPQSGINYYRLNTIDKDGSNELSGVKFVSFNVDDSEILSIYPNPVKDNLNVKWNFTISDDKTVSVLDLSGKKVLTFQNIQTSSITKNVSGLQKGVYILELSNQKIKQAIARKKFIKN